MMSNRTALAPIGPSGMNSLGAGRAVSRKSHLPGAPSSSAGGSQIPSSATGRKSIGGKEDPKLDTRRSMIPTGPSQGRVSLAPSSRPGIGRPSLNARPSMSGNRRTSRSSVAPAGGRYDSLIAHFAAGTAAILHKRAEFKHPRTFPTLFHLHWLTYPLQKANCSH